VWTVKGVPSGAMVAARVPERISDMRIFDEGVPRASSAPSGWTASELIGSSPGTE